MLNENGYHRPTYDEIINAKVQKAKELFGEDIDTSEQTPLGKFIRINAYDLALAYEDLEMTYYARFPNTAFGVSLDRLCVFAGIRRNPATQAIHSVKVNGEVGAEIGIGELVVAAADDTTFYNMNNFSIPDEGYITVDVICTVAGEAGNVDEINEIVNPIAEINSIEYVGIEKLGEEAESDADLRRRFSAAIEGAGSANANAIRAALMRIPTVISAGVIVNETDETDAKGRPPRSFECFLYGGENYKQEIGEAIFQKAPIGIKTCSTSSEPVSVTVLDDGGYEHVINFSFADYVPVHLKISIKKDARFESDGMDQIKLALMEHVNSLGMSADVIYSSLFGYIYSVNGVTNVTNLDLSTNGTTWSKNDIVINDWEVPTLASDDITIEVVE